MLCIYLHTMRYNNFLAKGVTLKVGPGLAVGGIFMCWSYKHTIWDMLSRITQDLYLLILSVTAVQFKHYTSKLGSACVVNSGNLCDSIT